MRDIWPMGCKKTPSDEKIEQLLKDPNYAAQQKIDGVRGILQFDSEGITHITTRGASLDNPDKPIEITHRLPQLQISVPKLAGTILDGEIWSLGYTSAQISGMISYKSTVPVDPGIVFNVFDILAINGNPTDKFDLAKRSRYLQSLNPLFKACKWIKYVHWAFTEEDKRQLLNREFEAGREGIVLKNLGSIYKLGTPGKEAKPANHWYKVKKHDTVDVTIIGSELPEHFYREPHTGIIDLDRPTKPWVMGWFGSISFKFINDNTTYYGSTAGMTDEMRERLSDGHHGILKEYIGRVIEVEFMEKTTDGNLRHPRFIGLKSQGTVRLREEIEK